MTEELFSGDSYAREFEAHVVKLDGREVILDRTAFYPGGGGQPADKGSLGIGPVRATVVDVRRESGRVVHVLDTAIPDTVLDLKGTLDWQRRYAHMRYHTALHVLSGVIWRNFEAKVTGGQMRTDRARMDFSFPGEWTTDVVGEIERLTNEALAEDRPVRVYELEREEALADPDLIRTLVNLYRTVFGESLVSQALYLTNNIGGPFAWERKIHPGTIRTHLAARHFRFEIAPDHPGEHVQGRVITHVRVPPLPIQGSLEVPHGIGNSGVQHVNHVPTFTSRIHDVRPHRTDAEGSFIRGLPSATGIKGGPVQDHLAAFELYDARFELPGVGVAREQLFGHSGSVPLSWFLNVATSR